MAQAPDQVPASLDDLKPGHVLLIRGRKATITQLDLPLVFYRYSADGPERHNSYAAHQDEFFVPANPNDRLDRSFVSVSASDSDVTISSFETSTKPPPPLAAPPAQPVSPQPKAAPPTQFTSSTHATGEIVPFPNKEDAEKNLKNAFSKRVLKRILENLEDDDIDCDAKMPQGLHIENCRNMSINVSHKIAQLTLLNCEQVRVEFAGVVSSAEMYKCTGCHLLCTDESCKTWTVEESKECRIDFPQAVDPVDFYVKCVSELQIFAQGDDDDPNMEDVRTTINSNAGDQQELIYWREGAFSDHVPVAREGSGYIVPQSQ